MVSDFLFPFWRATWHLWLGVPYHRIKGWWWKRNHPIEYLILKAAIETRMKETGGKLFPDLETDFDRRPEARLYGEMALTLAPRSKFQITDV